MNIKRSALALALALALCAGAAAQGAQILTIENGYSACYDFAGNDVGSAFELGIGFGLTDKLQAQVLVVNGDGGSYPDYRLLGLSYDLVPKFGIMTLIGQDGAAAAVAGIGLYSDLITRVAAGSLATGLRLKLGYIAPLSDVSQGIFTFGLAATIGM